MLDGNIEDDDFDIDFDHGCWDRLVATDFPDRRSALKAAQGVPPEKRADFWRGKALASGLSSFGA